MDAHDSLCFLLFLSWWVELVVRDLVCICILFPGIELEDGASGMKAPDAEFSLWYIYQHTFCISFWEIDHLLLDHVSAWGCGDTHDACWAWSGLVRLRWMVLLESLYIRTMDLYVEMSLFEFVSAGFSLWLFDIPLSKCKPIRILPQEWELRLRT